jgi:alkanesulfonate monooxygenase SsuD/methylene tetrahydromethanopterin reductase-like flavin-dependent oxidoreductase (luciferase family)
VCANLKSLLETGHVLPGAPWEIHADLRAAQMARHDPRPATAPESESVWSGEHVVLPDSAPPGFTMPPTLPFLDTTVALTLVAVNTNTIKLDSGIIVLPLRNPMVLAKELASVDVVSGAALSRDSRPVRSSPGTWCFAVSA